MTEITYAELMEELEKYRGRPNRNRTVLDIMTEEEKKFLWACRDHEIPISYARMAELYAERFNKPVKRSQMR